MIKLFRQLNPLNLLVLAGLLLLLRMPSILITHLPDSTTEFDTLVVEFPFLETIRNLFTAEVLQIIACVVIYVQALLLNRIIHQYSLLTKPSHLPALMYVVCSNLLVPFLPFRIVLLGNFFTIWLIKKNIELYRKSSAQMVVFDMGMLIAMGTYLYVPFLIVFPLSVISLLIFRSFNWREWIALPLGVLAIFIPIFTYYKLNHSEDILAEKFKFLKIIPHFYIAVGWQEYLILLPIMLVLVLSIIRLRHNFWKSYVLVRKFFQFLLIMLPFVGMSCYWATNVLSHFLLCMPALSVYMAYYFLNVERRWVYESLFGLIIVVLIYLRFSTLFLFG